MGEETKSACVSRRTVLIGAAGALPDGVGRKQRQGGQDVAVGGALPGLAKGRQAMRRLQPVHRTERMQKRRRNDLADRVVRALGQEGGLTIRLRQA